MKKLSLKMMAMMAAVMMSLTAEAKTQDVGGRVIDQNGLSTSNNMSFLYSGEEGEACNYPCNREDILFEVDRPFVTELYHSSQIAAKSQL